MPVFLMHAWHLPNRSMCDALMHDSVCPPVSTVLFGDIGFKAAGSFGRNIVYVIIYSLDATRCVILHLAAAQSLRHIFPIDSRPPVWQCGAAVLVAASALVQVPGLFLPPSPTPSPQVVALLIRAYSCRCPLGLRPPTT